MSLLEEIQSRKPVKLCRFGRWLQAAPKQDRADIATAFSDVSIKGIWIADVLASQIDGHIVDYIRLHRRGACDMCPATESYLNVAS